MITTANLTNENLKQIILELLLNKTDNVSDVSDDSVTNGVAFGCAKVGQKAIKDIAIVEAQIFPEYATGEYLDRAAALAGVSSRKTAIGSSTYLKVVGTSGTQYIAGTNNFVNQNGIVFELESDFTVGDLGYGYLKVRSVDTGVKTNVPPNSIITVTPEPSGHSAVTNEYKAIRGADNEDDETFRIRIVNNLNILSIGTIEYFTQVFQNIDDRVLRVLNLGTNNAGKRVLSIATQNGVDLTPSELSNLLESSKDFFPITDLNRFGDTIGIVLQNAEWYIVGGATGVDFRVDISSSADSDEVRQNIQIGMSKYLDFRFWESGQKVEWDELLDVVKGTENVRYVPDSFFRPNIDEIVPVGQLPRIKDFVMRDLDGNIIFDSNNVLSPVFYPNE